MATGRVAVYAHQRIDLADLDHSGLVGRPAAAVATMHGPQELVAHLPAAYLDEILLRDRKRDGLERLHRMRSRLLTAREALPDEPEQSLGPVNLYEYVSDAAPYCVIETKLHATWRARSSGRPRRHFPYALEAAFWGYWNWVLIEQTSLAPLAVQPLLDNLLLQFEYYDAKGLSMRHLGKAVAYAGFGGSAERYVEEQAARAGLTPEEYRDLPAEERSALVEESMKEDLARQQNASLIEARATEIAERWDTLWESDRNPLQRRGEGPGEIELAIIKYTAKEDSLRWVLAGRDTESDAFTREGILTARLMGAGYLWREAERNGRSDPLPALESAMEWVLEHPGEDDPDRVTRMVRAVTGIMRSFASLGYLEAETDVADDRQIVADAVLEHGAMYCLASIAQDTEPRHISLPNQDVVEMFKAGIALREIEQRVI